MATGSRAALDRVLRGEGRQQAFDVLCQQLSGSELTTTLLGVYERRAQGITLSDARRQYELDRFVQPAPVDPLRQARVELAALEAATESDFEAIGLAPVTPLGLHHALGGTPQNNVISTSRGTEVAADPTNVLALEAAQRRSQLLRDANTRAQTVDLAATQRVTRAQHFDGPRSFAHFSIFGLVSAGRDQGDLRFEMQSIARHIDVLVATLRKLTAAPISVRLSPFNADLQDVCNTLCMDLEQRGIAASVWRDREHGREYYRNVCFKVYVHFEGEPVELGDGGDVDWMQGLLQSRKERMTIGGLGLERVAMLMEQ